MRGRWAPGGIVLTLALTGCGTTTAGTALGPPAPPSTTTTPVSSSAAPASSPPATTTNRPVVAQAGNPAGRASVPAEARAEDTSRPTRVIGDGTPASCTSPAVVSAVAT